MLSPHTSYRWRGERDREPIKCMRSPHTSHRWRGESHRDNQVYALTTHQPQVERRESHRDTITDYHCPLSPTLFNIYINELAKVLEQSSAPGLTLHDSNIKFLLFADDLVLLSPTEEGLQQNLDILHKFCQTWALTINANETKILTFQKRPRFQGKRHNFTLGMTKIEHATNYTYLGLKISATGKLN